MLSEHLEPVYNPHRWLDPWEALRRAIDRERLIVWRPSSEDRIRSMIANLTRDREHADRKRREARTERFRQTLEARRAAREAA
jgi:hypothetical protein